MSPVPPAEWAQNLAAVLTPLSPLIALFGVVVGYRLNARKSDAHWVLSKGYEAFIAFKDATLAFADAGTTLNDRVETAVNGVAISTEEFNSTIRAGHDVQHLGNSLMFLFRDTKIDELVDRITENTVSMHNYFVAVITDGQDTLAWEDLRDPSRREEEYMGPDIQNRLMIMALEVHIQEAYYPRPPRRRRRWIRSLARSTSIAL